jgi:hypothetical protein
MQIKTNVRAGAGTQKQKGGTSTDSTSVQTADSINNTVVSYTYIPAISRCVGI